MTFEELDEAIRVVHALGADGVPLEYANRYFYDAAERHDGMLSKEQAEYIVDLLRCVNVEGDELGTSLLAHLTRAYSLP